jgi:hypothetical protein
MDDDRCLICQQLEAPARTRDVAKANNRHGTTKNLGIGEVITGRGVLPRTGAPGVRIFGTGGQRLGWSCAGWVTSKPWNS